MQLPETFRQNIINTFKERGRVRLKRLPALLLKFEADWSIEIHTPFPNLTFNYVAPVSLADGSKAVFKAGVPHPETLMEMKALKTWNGNGAVRLLNSNKEQGVMLLEKLEPGVSFWHRDSDEATLTCADLLLQLWQAKPPEGRTLKSWTKALEHFHINYAELNCPLEWPLLDKAMQLRNELLKSNDKVLLHADLAHDNILSASRQPFLAIDPKGIVGPRGYDVASFLVNPEGFHEHDDLENRLERRLSMFSESLNLDKRELAAWGFMHCLLSVCWSLEANQYPGAPEMLAHKLEPFIS